MESSSPYRLVHFTNPDDFVAATKKHDDSFMNFALGALLDSMNKDLEKSNERWGGGPRTLVGVYRDEVLVATLTKIAKDFSWIIASPRESAVDSSEIPAIVQPIVTFLPSIIDPKALDKILGPVQFVDIFFEQWISHMSQTGLSLRLLDPYFKSKVSYATLASLADPNPAFAVHKVFQAGATDVDSLAHLYIGFSTVGPDLPTLEEARAVVMDSAQLGNIWVCKEGDTIAGYILVGRFTPQTVAIKNVFTSTVHRRKGVAEAMVRAVTRYYLGAEPQGFEGGLEEGPSGGIKEEICLNVASDEAGRLYKRVGFLLGANDPVTGKVGWYPSCWRGVEEIKDAEAK